MKKLFVLCFAFLILLNCTEKKRALKGDTKFQKELNAFYKDASTSPLKKKDRKNFEGLNFFDFDSTYVVEAEFRRTPNEHPFEMKTTTDRRPIYLKYGEISFNLKQENYTLDIFLGQNEEGEYYDYLFLPFLDETNGFDSYGGGRYINSTFPDGNTLVIDFNTAYNPYCAYNEAYSCPIVPRQNYLETKVEAGVKAFSKH